MKLYRVSTVNTIPSETSTYLVLANTLTEAAGLTPISEEEACISCFGEFISMSGRTKPQVLVWLTQPSMDKSSIISAQTPEDLIKRLRIAIREKYSGKISAGDYGIITYLHGLLEAKIETLERCLRE